ncbi:MAG: RNA-directed DNA polymerase [Muribaculaceae bacterium]|nr:RNA-directed DNA polymerase [Muribaculaceae bacterium]
MNIELYNMLSRGYFPKELPPAFNTYDFAFEAENIAKELKSKWCNKISEPSVFSIPKNGIGRRMLSIINPYSFYNLAYLLTSDTIYANLKKVCQQSSVSVSKPIRCNDHNKRSIIPNCKSVSDFQTIKLSRGLYKRVELKIDISCFYSTIYTHAITWMMVGKMKAKEIWRGRLSTKGYTCGDPNLDNLYNQANQIDTLIECCQEKQTHGIPVGPDTSFIIAETLLCHIDNNIQNKFPGIQGCRYYDDWFFYVDTHDDATRLLRIVIDTLGEFGLEVNLSKVEINEMPIAVLDDFAERLSSFNFRTASIIERIKVFFEVLWSLIRNDRNRAATFTRYAMRVLIGFLSQDVVDSLSKDNKELIQIMLFRTVSDLPECIPAILPVMQGFGTISKKQILDNLVDSILERHIALDHHIEVAWTLWICKLYNVNIATERVTEILKKRNSVCSLLLLDYINNVVPALKQEPEVTNAITDLHNSLSPDSLYDKDWLLLYEGVRKGWLQGFDNLVDNDPFFGKLRQKDISFYDENSKADYKSSEYLLSCGKNLSQHLKDKIMKMIKSQKENLTDPVDNTKVGEQAGESVKSSASIFEIKQTDVDFKDTEEIMRAVLKGEINNVEEIKRNYSRLKRTSRIS